MFCTKCGKELHDGDRFCAHCGAEVREAKRSKYDDVVFNPPFRMEAQRRTEEILRSTGSQPEMKKKETVAFDWNLDGFPTAQPRKTEEVDFNWDSVVERRNSVRQIKVEKIEPEQELFFAGASAIEEPTKEVPRIREEFSFWTEPEVKEEPKVTAEEVVKEEPAVEIPEITELKRELEIDEPAMTIEDLERELFGDAEEEIPQATEFKPADERFYTYNQKFDAFQELLEKEKQRLEEMESGSHDLKNMDYTWVGEVFPELKKEPEVVSVAQPSLTMSVEIDKINEAVLAMEAEKAAEEAAVSEPEIVAEPEPAAEAEPEAEEVPAAEPEAPEVQEEPETTEVPAEDSTPSKTKLRYSDIFPRDMVGDSAGDGGTAETEEKEAEKPVKPVSVPAPAKEEKTQDKPSIASIYDDLDEDDEPKKHVFAKIVIGILLVLILAEGIIIGAKFLAPDSKISLWANDMMLGVLNMVMGGEEDPAGEDEEEGKEGLYSNAEKVVYMDSLIAEASAEMKSIGEAMYNDELTFDMLDSYSFEEIPDADNFVDADWYEDSDGSSVTYGEKLMESLIRYYDSWQAVNTDESLVGINSLEFGEIKTGKEGFYALCKVTYAGADGGSVEEYHTVYLRISDKTMIINEIKEGNL